MATKVLVIEQVSTQLWNDVFDDCLRTVACHKDLIEDWRFGSLVCSISLVRSTEKRVKFNLERIIAAEAITGHGIHN
jgi:predicted GNAT family N-acyltransferase